MKTLNIKHLIILFLSALLIISCASVKDEIDTVATEASGVKNTVASLIGSGKCSRPDTARLKNINNELVTLDDKISDLQSDLPNFSDEEQDSKARKSLAELTSELNKLKAEVAEIKKRCDGAAVFQVKPISDLEELNLRRDLSDNPVVLSTTGAVITPRTGDQDNVVETNDDGGTVRSTSDTSVIVIPTGISPPLNILTSDFSPGEAKRRIAQFQRQSQALGPETPAPEALNTSEQLPRLRTAGEEETPSVRSITFDDKVNNDLLLPDSGVCMQKREDGNCVESFSMTNTPGLLIGTRNGIRTVFSPAAPVVPPAGGKTDCGTVMSAFTGSGMVFSAAAAGMFSSAASCSMIASSSCTNCVTIVVFSGGTTSVSIFPQGGSVIFSSISATLPPPGTPYVATVPATVFGVTGMVTITVIDGSSITASVVFMPM